MLAHYQYIGFLPALPAFKYSGQCGLMVFFFLSSFLLCHSLASDPNWAARPHLSLLTYSINRIFRIFPLLCVVIAADILERIVVLSSLHRLLGGAETVGSLSARRRAFSGRFPSNLRSTSTCRSSWRWRCRRRDRASAARRWRRLFSGGASRSLSRGMRAFRRRPWMTLGFHHYANSFVGGVLLYALIANGRIRFPRSAAWVAAIAPLAFVLAMPFCRFALLRHDPWMAELAAPGRVAVLLRRNLPVRAARRRRNRLRPSPSLGIAFVARHASRTFA